VTTLPPWPVQPTLEVPKAPGSRRDWKNESWGERYRRDHHELLEIAATLASELGYEGTQVSDIVRLASVSNRTFYDHFDSKAACFVHLIRNARLNIIAAMIAAAEAAAPLGPHETFRRMLDVWRMQLATRPRLYAAMRSPQVEALWQEQRAGIDQMAEIFAVAAIRLGSTEAEVGLTRLSRYFTWGAFGFLSHVVMGDDVVEEDLSAMATALCRGFGLVGSDVGSR
jgi:AcrR family transcriptional regulator